MQVQCNHSQDCPIKDCPHRAAHSPTFTMALLAFKPIEVEAFCDDVERICGKRFPKEKIAVICKPIEGENVATDATAEWKEPIPA